MGVLEGFCLHREDFRDFMTIYNTGQSRDDDPLGKMTMYKLDRKFKGNIDESWGFPFEQTGFNFMPNKKPQKISLVRGRDEDLVKKLIEY